MNWKKRFVPNKIIIEQILRKENPTEEEQQKVLEYYQKNNIKLFEEVAKKVANEQHTESVGV